MRHCIQYSKSFSNDNAAFIVAHYRPSHSVSYAVSRVPLILRAAACLGFLVFHGKSRGDRLT